MKRNYTQEECREMWEKLFYSEAGPTIEAIDIIDTLTPLSEIEPNWWLDMMEERKYILKKKGII